MSASVSASANASACLWCLAFVVWWHLQVGQASLRSLDGPLGAVAVAAEDDTLVFLEHLKVAFWQHDSQGHFSLPGWDVRSMEIVSKSGFFFNVFCGLVRQNKVFQKKTGLRSKKFVFCSSTFL